MADLKQGVGWPAGDRTMLFSPSTRVRLADGGGPWGENSTGTVIKGVAGINYVLVKWDNSLRVESVAVSMLEAVHE